MSPTHTESPGGAHRNPLLCTPCLLRSDTGSVGSPERWPGLRKPPAFWSPAPRWRCHCQGERTRPALGGARWGRADRDPRSAAHSPGPRRAAPRPRPRRPALTSWGSSRREAAGRARHRRRPAPRPGAGSPGSRCAARRLPPQPRESRPCGARTRDSGSWQDRTAGLRPAPRRGLAGAPQRPGETGPGANPAPG